VLQLTTNPEQSILPGMVRQSLEILRDGTFYLHRLVGEELRRIAAGPPSGSATMPDADIASLSVAINRTMTRLEKHLFPPVVELEVTARTAAAEPAASFAVLFLPGVVLMSLLFMAQGISEDVWQERAQGTLRRAAGTPGGVVPLLLGKLASGGILMAAVSLVILALGMVYLAIPLSRLPLALPWSAFCGFVLLVFMILIQLYASSRRAGSVLTTSLIFPLMMIGGSLFPSETMPRWMAAVGRRTPNGWALERLKDILLDRAEPQSLLVGSVMLLVAAAIAFGLSARRLRRVFAWS